ncbi:MAG TPA: FAD:protein FMN transferase, partial [Saprospiraceae bacterium]|nr:FAD:protein FMN transferase [Saprospiraceae bacterium]
MVKNLFLIVAVFFSLTAYAQKYKFTQPHLGTYFTIVIDTQDTVGMLRCVQDAFSLVMHYDTIFSDYITNSECNTLSHEQTNQWIPVSKPMYEVLKEATYACKKSKGFFNVTIGKASKLWREYQNQDIPDEAMSEA